MKNNPCVIQSPSEKLDRTAARLCWFSIRSSLCSPLMSQNLTSPSLASLGFPPLWLRRLQCAHSVWHPRLTEFRFPFLLWVAGFDFSYPCYYPDRRGMKACWRWRELGSAWREAAVAGCRKRRTKSSNRGAACVYWAPVMCQPQRYEHFIYDLMYAL